MCVERYPMFFIEKRKKEWKFVQRCNELRSAWKKMNMEKAFISEL